jgi:hypothetical protein
MINKYAKAKIEVYDDKNYINSLWRLYDPQTNLGVSCTHVYSCQHI